MPGRVADAQHEHDYEDVASAFRASPSPANAENEQLARLDTAGADISPGQMQYPIRNTLRLLQPYGSVRRRDLHLLSVRSA